MRLGYHKGFIIWVELFYSTPIIETYLCDSLRFLVIRLRLGVNNSDTQTNSLLAWDNCTISIVFLFIPDSDFFNHNTTILYFGTAKSGNRKFASKYIILFYIVYVLTSSAY